MNNEVINNSQIKELNPSKVVLPNDTAFSAADYLNRIALMTYSFEFTLFIINIVLCLATIRNIKQNKILLIISIIAVCFAKVFKMITEFAGGLEGVEQNYDGLYIMIIITFIIQLIIFIKLIINIVKNIKKEEP